LAHHENAVKIYISEKKYGEEEDDFTIAPLFNKKIEKYQNNAA